MGSYFLEDKTVELDNESIVNRSNRADAIYSCDDWFHQTKTYMALFTARNQEEKK